MSAFSYKFNAGHTGFHKFRALGSFHFSYSTALQWNAYQPTLTCPRPKEGGKNTAKMANKQQAIDHARKYHNIS